MAKRDAAAVALTLGLLAFSPAAPAQLPPAIQADRLQVQAERQVREREYSAALETLDRSLALREEHGLEVPESFWFQRAEVSMNAGLYAQAVESATRYLEAAGQDGERYRAALELLDRAERLVAIRAPEMVTIPAGSFRMGCVSGLDCQPWEEPVHTVTITRPFALSKHEITFDQWDACVAAGGCGGYRPSDMGWGRSSHPVFDVSWEDTQSYVSWLSP